MRGVLRVRRAQGRHGDGVPGATLGTKLGARVSDARGEDAIGRGGARSGGKRRGRRGHGRASDATGDFADGERVRDEQRDGMFLLSRTRARGGVDGERGGDTARGERARG